MSRQSVWYYTNLPIEIVDIIERDLSQYGDNNLMKSEVIGSKVNITTRNSLNTWVNDNHWIVGFLWHYVMKANNENFLYFIGCLLSKIILEKNIPEEMVADIYFELKSKDTSLEQNQKYLFN